MKAYMRSMHQNFDNLRIIPDREPVEVDWYGDASTLFGLGLKEKSPGPKQW